MSINNWIGGLIRKTPPTPSGPYQNSTAPGIWTLTQVANYIKQGIWPTAGNVNPDAFIENLFSTYLYTGNGSTQTITNGIDLAAKGGLVWTKDRSGVGAQRLFDTARGVNKVIYANATDAQSTEPNTITAFNSNGFSLGDSGNTNANNANFVSWTFREQAKFFDVVTYTGNGTTQAITHSLGSTPGCIIVKRTSAASNTGWAVYHRSLGAAYRVFLNLTNAATTAQEEEWFGNNAVSVAPTSTQFTVGSNQDVNANGNTYVAYLFAHDAGGFGLTGTDNVISCGSYTGNGSATGPTVTLGYEPQLVMVKRSDAAANWVIFDNMRGMSLTASMLLYPNLADDEGIGTQSWISPTATGFQPAITNGTVNANGGTYVYVAIRRGPMKTPTTGTSVFSPNAVTMTTSTPTTVTTNFPVDLTLNRRRGSAADCYAMDRLRGGSQTTYSFLRTQSTLAEQNGGGVGVGFDSNTSLVDNSWLSGVASNTIWWNFRRAPGFFDEVCYTGTGSATTFSHNLGVVPELMIVKARNSSSYDWGVYSATTGASNVLKLNLTDASTANSFYFNGTTPTASVFSLGTSAATNGSGTTYVAYLFASCPGVSKVGSYTGTGTTLQVNCGFTGGARFVLIKRTDSTGDWYVWDSARGIVAGNDPYLLLNSTAAEVTNTDYVDTYSAGFEISSTAPAAINANGGTFIFLAIA